MGLIATATAQDEHARRERGPAVAVLSVGSFEQHGDFLPLITDTAIACLIAERLSAAYDLFLLPPVTLSCSQEHEGLPGRPGAVSLSARTLVAVLDGVRQSLRRTGGIDPPWWLFRSFREPVWALASILERSRGLTWRGMAGCTNWLACAWTASPS